MLHLLARPSMLRSAGSGAQCDSDGDGFVTYEASHPDGLSNQGWKDSWDGVNFADGRSPQPPIALVEVQGYAYAAFRGAAELAGTMPLRHDAAGFAACRGAQRTLQREVLGSSRLVRARFGRAGDPIDSLTTNPGHALWCGIADDSLADPSRSSHRIDRCGPVGGFAP